VITIWTLCVFSGMVFLRHTVPDEQQELLSYFDSTYVNGSFRSVRRNAASSGIQRLALRRVPLLFPVTSWNVHDSTLTGQARINKLCESWNQGLAAHADAI